jgi:hypothetical protein
MPTLAQSRIQQYPDGQSLAVVSRNYGRVAGLVYLTVSA